MFLRSEVVGWLNGEFDSIRLRIGLYESKWFSNSNSTYLDFLKHAYRIIEQHYRNEYVVKNSFLNQWLIKELGTCESRVYSEFRVGNSRADLAIFNGCSRAFEIKTEFDSDARLSLQLDNYRKAFNEIYLIVPEQKLNSYLKYDESVGIVSYGGTKNAHFEKVRESRRNELIDHQTVMQIFHTKEYRKIVRAKFKVIPQMTSFNQYKICSNLVSSFSHSELNEVFVETMKRRPGEVKLSERNHREFNQLCLALGMSGENRRRLIEKLRTPLNT